MSIDSPCIPLINDNFQAEVLAAPTLVLVDCWASWCGAAQPANPLLEAVAIEFTGRIKVGRLNLAQAESVAMHYGIRAVPTLLFFQQGQIVGRLIGGISPLDLRRKLDTLLPSVAVIWSGV